MCRGTDLDAYRLEDMVRGGMRLMRSPTVSGRRVMIVMLIVAFGSSGLHRTMVVGFQDQMHRKAQDRKNEKGKDDARADAQLPFSRHQDKTLCSHHLRYARTTSITSRLACN